MGQIAYSLTSWSRRNGAGAQLQMEPEPSCRWLAAPRRHLSRRAALRGMGRSSVEHGLRVRAVRMRRHSCLMPLHLRSLALGRESGCGRMNSTACDRWAGVLICRDHPTYGPSLAVFKASAGDDWLAPVAAFRPVRSGQGRRAVICCRPSLRSLPLRPYLRVLPRLSATAR